MTRRVPIMRERPRLRPILRLREVEQTTGIKRSTIYEGIEAGTFPKQIPLAPRAVGWLEDEIAAWVEARIAERAQKAADGQPQGNA
jgi:prophage regulatory protein